MKNLDDIAVALTIIGFGIVGVLLLTIEYSHEENMAKIECVKAKGE